MRLFCKSSFFFLFYLLITNHLHSQEIAPPQISVLSGFYTEDFEVELTHEDPEVQILFTIDGSTPTIDHIEGKEWHYKINYQRHPDDIDGELLKDTMRTHLYGEPITIENLENIPDRYADISASYIMNETYNDSLKPHLSNVFKGVNLRAVAYKDGEYSEVLTRNYFITPEGNSRYTLPVICLSIDPDLFFGYEEGIYVPGILFDEWRTENPNEEMEVGSDNWRFAPGNFRIKGEETEREINFNYFENGIEKLNQNGGLRINGNTSKFFSNRALRLYAKKDYGEKNFKYEFFNDYPLDKFKRLILRNSGGDTRLTMLRDAFSHDVVRNTHSITQQYQPVILFINGEYWGLYNLRERYDKKYFNNKFNIPEEELDYIKVTEVKEGSIDKYMELYNFLRQNTLSDETNLNHFLTLVDVENLVDYIIIETFYSNIDWPTNNNEYFRKRIEFDGSNFNEDDGRFRWLIKDLDVGLGDRWDYMGYNFDDISAFLTPNSNEDNWTLALKQPFRSLMENEKYKLYFINRYCDLLNTTFKESRLTGLWESYTNRIEPEIEEFTERWTPGQSGLFGSNYIVPSYNAWLSNIQVVEDFILNRQPIIREHIRNQFETGLGEYEITLEVSDEEQGYIQINTLTLDEETDGIEDQVYPWAGIYLKSVPQKLKAIAKEGYEFSHWSGDVNTTDSLFTLSFSQNTYLKAHFVPEGTLDVTHQNDSKVLIYPNPVSNSLCISSEQVSEFTITDVMGKEIHHSTLQNGLHTIDVSHWEAGVFFITVAQGKTFKFIKE